MIINSTKFDHPKYHKVTWISPNKEPCVQIDHIQITKTKQTFYDHSNFETKGLKTST